MEILDIIPHTVYNESSQLTNDFLYNAKGESVMTGYILLGVFGVLLVVGIVLMALKKKK